MRITVLVIVAIVSSLLIGNCMAKSANKDNDANDVPKVLSVKSANKNMDAIEISRVLSAEYAKYKQQVTGQYDVNDCNSVFALISSARTSLLKSAKSSAAKKRDYRKAYRASWRECIKMKQKSKDPSVQKLILEKWNNSLIEDSNDVPFQLYALGYPLGDRSFFTDNFWKLLQQSNKKNTIAAISYLLYQSGNAEDMKKLSQRQKPGVDIQLLVIIAKAKRHMHHRLRGRTHPRLPTRLPNVSPSGRRHSRLPTHLPEAPPRMRFDDIQDVKIEKKRVRPPRSPLFDNRRGRIKDAKKYDPNDISEENKRFQEVIEKLEGARLMEEAN